MQNECKDCRFWWQHEEDEGECHRYAPRPLMRKDRANASDHHTCTEWPVTLSYDGCGEWVARAAEKTPAE